MIRFLRAWWHYRRELRQARHDCAFAYRRWMRSYRMYQDIGEIYRDQPDRWSELATAQDESIALSEEYRRKQAALDRLREAL